jgi:hypothetical protein
MRDPYARNGCGDPINNLAGTVERVLINHDFVCLIFGFSFCGKILPWLGD